MKKKMILFLVFVISVYACYAEWSLPRNLAIDASMYGPADRANSGMISLEFYKVYKGRFTLLGNVAGYYGANKDENQSGAIADTLADGTHVDKVVYDREYSTLFIPIMLGGRIDVYESKGIKYFVGAGFGLGIAIDMDITNLVSGLWDAGQEVDGNGNTVAKDFIQDRSNLYYGFNYQLNTGASYIAKEGIEVYGKIYYNGADLRRDTGLTADEVGLGDRVNMSGWGAGIGARFPF